MASDGDLTVLFSFLTRNLLYCISPRDTDNRELSNNTGDGNENATNLHIW